MRALLFILLITLLCASCKKDEAPESIPHKLDLPSDQKNIPERTILDVSYGPDSLNNMDVFLPEGRKPTTKFVILLHGGAWVWGDKSADGLGYLRIKLVQNGYAVASMNYRRACNDHHKQMEDVDMVIKHIQDHSTEWVCSDTEFGLMGRSSGAHLALLYAYAFDTANVVKTVVSIVAPTDLTDTVFHQYADNAGFLWAVERLVGATYANNPQVFHDASPINHISNKPTFFLCGSQDTVVPYHQSIRMFETLRSSGITADTTVYSNAGHNILGQNDVNRPAIEHEVVNWFEVYLP